MKFFVTGIDTDSGKTLAAAILCQALQADYWKPIQAGLPHDTDMVSSLISNDKSFMHAERYVLNTPASPHAAAKIDNIEINVEDFALPKTTNSLVVEGAGGCLVPINDKEFVADLIVKLGVPAIVVADLYLGSINHTLLTIEALQSRHIDVEGIIFNGPANHESQRIILQHSGLKQLLHIDREQAITKSVVQKYANMIKENWL